MLLLLSHSLSRSQRQQCSRSCQSTHPHAQMVPIRNAYTCVCMCVRVGAYIHTYIMHVTATPSHAAPHPHTHTQGERARTAPRSNLVLSRLVLIVAIAGLFSHAFTPLYPARALALCNQQQQQQQSAQHESNIIIDLSHSRARE